MKTQYVWIRLNNRAGDLGKTTESVHNLPGGAKISYLISIGTFPKQHGPFKNRPN